MRRLADAGLTERAARGVYLTVGAASFDGWVADHIVAALQRDHLTYLSLESALSDYGAISQVPFCRTFMTTGRGGLVDVLDGQVELVHTARSVESILARTVETGRQVRLATPEAAYEDLVRVGRNLHLVDMDWGLTDVAAASRRSSASSTSADCALVDVSAAASPRTRRQYPGRGRGPSRP